MARGDLTVFKEELDSIKILNALIAEQEYEEQLRFEEEELIVLLLAA